MPNDFEIVGILKTKLVHLDQDCEGETHAALAKLHSSVKSLSINNHDFV